MNEILMILAVLVAPLVAVQVQRWIEDYRRESERKEWIFKTLMATRAEGLSRDHVNALNMIDIEYYKDRKGTRVVEKWKEYLDQLGSFPRSNVTDENVKQWSVRRDDIFTDMLYEMAVRLGYKFDKVTLRKGVYSPQAFSDLELEQKLIRKGLCDILSEDKSIPIRVTVPEEDAQRQASLQEAMMKYYKAEGATTVEPQDPSEETKS